jgi:hypothetical protein
MEWLLSSILGLSPFSPRQEGRLEQLPLSSSLIKNRLPEQNKKRLCDEAYL